MTKLLQSAFFSILHLAWWSSLVAAQSFSDLVPGVYTVTDDIDLPVQLVLWDEGENYAGVALLDAQDAKVFAEKDGPFVRGSFEVAGTLQLFRFVPTNSGAISARFSGKAAPVAMVRTSLPGFAGKYEGAFGALIVRSTKGGASARLIRPDGTAVKAEGKTEGLRVTFPQLNIVLHYALDEDSYFAETADFFGKVERAPAPILVGDSQIADTASLAAALANAPEGAVIELLEGSHQGPFVVDRMVSITGTSPQSVLTLDSADGAPVLTWSGPKGRLANVTVEAPKNGLGLHVTGGLELSDVNFESAPQAIAIRATGDADVDIRTTTVEGGKHALLIQQFSGALKLTESTLANTSKSIVSVVDVMPESRISLSNNLLFGSPSNGLRLSNAGLVELQGNTVNDVRVGLYQSGGVSTTLDGDVITSIGAHGLWFEGAFEQRIDISNTKIFDVAEACVLLNNLVAPNDGVEISQTALSRCKGFGIVIAGSETTPSPQTLNMRNVGMEANGSHLAIYSPSSIAARDVGLLKAAGPAIILGEGANLDLVSAVLREATGHGIVAVGDGISLNLADTEVSSATGSGVVISGRSQLSLVQTEITQNGEHGLEIHQGAVVEQLDDVAISENGAFGVLVSGSGFTPGPTAVIEENAKGAILRQ